MNADDFLKEALEYEEKSREAGRAGDFNYAGHCLRMRDAAFQDAVTMENKRVATLRVGTDGI